MISATCGEENPNPNLCLEDDLFAALLCFYSKITFADQRRSLSLVSQYRLQRRSSTVWESFRSLSTPASSHSCPTSPRKMEWKTCTARVKHPTKGRERERELKSPVFFFSSFAFSVSFSQHRKASFVQGKQHISNGVKSAPELGSAQHGQMRPHAGLWHEKPMFSCSPVVKDTGRA